MLTIYKYQVPIEDEFVLQMPEEAKILCVQMQGDEPFVWAICDASKPPERRKFSLRGTGHVLDDHLRDGAEYVGTFQVYDGALVFHLFERRKLEEEP